MIYLPLLLLLSILLLLLLPLIYSSSSFTSSPRWNKYSFAIICWNIRHLHFWDRLTDKASYRSSLPDLKKIEAMESLKKTWTDLLVQTFSNITAVHWAKSLSIHATDNMIFHCVTWWNAIKRLGNRHPRMFYRIS